MARTKTNTRDDTKTLTTSWRNRHLENIYMEKMWIFVNKIKICTKLHNKHVIIVLLCNYITDGLIYKPTDYTYTVHACYNIKYEFIELWQHTPYMFGLQLNVCRSLHAKTQQQQIT